MAKIQVKAEPNDDIQDYEKHECGDNAFYITRNPAEKNRNDEKRYRNCNKMQQCLDGEIQFFGFKIKGGYGIKPACKHASESIFHKQWSI